MLLSCSDRDGFNRDGSNRVPVEKVTYRCSNRDVVTEMVPIPIEMVLTGF